MPNGATASCWMCGSPADSREHIFKARDLKRIFDKDGYSPEAQPFHFGMEDTVRLQGPKARRVKYPAIICTRCNNERTSTFDRAYDRLSDWFMSNQGRYDLSEIDFLDVYGSQYEQRLEELHWFFVKSLGCRIVSSPALLPDNFPNPISKANGHLFFISICRSQPFRYATVKEYEPTVFETFLGKGDLFVHLSKSRLESEGIRLAKSAIWWENMGHFQVNYWFNIEMDSSLGKPLGHSGRTYQLVHTELGLDGMKKSMWRWLETHPSCV